MSTENDLVAALCRMNLARADETPSIAPLSGGVSCDVFRAALRARTICVKRALARLRVTADWRAPVERAHNEVAWLRFAASVDPRCVPAVLGEDREAHIFAMTYLEPAHYPCWKTLMLEGTVEPHFAGAVGTALAAIHRASVGRAEVARQFATDDLFLALRIEPYLLFTAKTHPDRGRRICEIAESVAAAHIALMQGDISPKNILKGPHGPVFLDAETACYGDPAFDLAFCLNHLLLKAVHLPVHAGALAASFEALRDTYFSHADWEERDGLDRRTASLLGALLLARIDGKSPVEYLTRDADKNFVRDAARAYLTKNDLTLRDVLGDWHRRLGNV